MPLLEALLPPRPLPAPEGAGTWGRLKHKFYFYWLLVVGVLPAVVIGLLAKKSGLLGWLLDSVEVVAVMLVVGGVFMLFATRYSTRAPRRIA